MLNQIPCFLVIKCSPHQIGINESRGSEGDSGSPLESQNGSTNWCHQRETGFCNVVGPSVSVTFKNLVHLQNPTTGYFKEVYEENKTD